MKSSASPTDRIFRFGQFELSEREGALRRNGIRIKVQERPFRVLIELLVNAGNLVTREELQQKLGRPTPLSTSMPGSTVGPPGLSRPTVLSLQLSPTDIKVG